MGDVIGFEGKVYWDDTPLAGAPETGDWTELTIARDVTMGVVPTPAEVTTRRHGGAQAFAYGLEDEPVDVVIAHDTEDAGYVALWTAYTTRAPIALAIMDGDITEGGISGIAGNWIVAEFGRPEALGEAMTRTVKLKPATYMAEYAIPDPSLDNVLATLSKIPQELGLTGDYLGAAAGVIYLTDAAVWGEETIKNAAPVVDWAAGVVNFLADEAAMDGFPGDGETVYAWLVTAHGIVSTNSDSFVYDVA